MDEAIAQKYFSPDCLILAWERIIRSTGKDSKDQFGIEVYQSDLEANLIRLSQKLQNGQFEPNRPFKYYEPKASKTHRTKSVLYIEDALVYQCIANTVATNNYKKLTENNSSVFGSVLHPEVEKGLDLLKEEEPDFYFFQYYIPLYNKFINSVNTEIANTNIKFKLETDITGFFDGIPHSKLLVALNNFGVEPAILDLLADSLNYYSGTKDSITPGVGIPQGAPASFFLANLFLYDLDYIIGQKGYTYYRYMDDIRIYEETEEKLTEVLVLIDNYLKGKALSLNTKKTSIEELGTNREEQMLTVLQGYNDQLSDPSPAQTKTEEDKCLDYAALLSELMQDVSYLVKTVSDEELIEICQNQLKESETYLLEKFSKITDPDLNSWEITSDENIKKNIIGITYKWRNANTILKNFQKEQLNLELIPIWLFCLEHFFWKANHFCWNLNLYGPNDHVREKLQALLSKFTYYEWVRYQILSNLSTVQTFDSTQLKKLFRASKEESSSLVRIGYYMILLKHLNIEHQLYASLRQAIKDDADHYIKGRIFRFISTRNSKNKLNDLKYWFGL